MVTENQQSCLGFISADMHLRSYIKKKKNEGHKLRSVHSEIWDTTSVLFLLAVD